MKFFTFFTNIPTYIKVIALILSGVLISALFIATKPVTKRIKPKISSPLVSVMPATLDTATLNVSALGTVKAAQETIIRVRVSGQIEELSPRFEVGGFVQKDEMLLRLDASDYNNALALKKSALDKAKAEYSLEMGQQRVARTELAQLNKTAPGTVKNTELALRVPQLNQAKAAVQSAETDVKQAQLDLERTQITAPYNALIIERNMSLGSQAATSDTVGTLVGTDEYRIEAAIPLDRLQSLGMTTFDGASVQVYSGNGHVREGFVLHAVASLDSSTRMGRVLISVPDPLGFNTEETALILGDQAQVVMEAGILYNVVTLPRAVLRGNNHVWIAQPTTNNEYILDIRAVDIAWKDTQSVVISSGIEANEYIITSPLGAPIQGMPVRLDKRNNIAKENIISDEHPKSTLDTHPKPHTKAEAVHE